MVLQGANTMLRFSRIVDSINEWTGKILCYLILVIMLTGVYEVGMRYFFNMPTRWVWEMNGLILCVLAALGGGYALLEHAHVRVDIVYDRFSTRTKAIIDLCSSSFMFLFLVVLVWQTSKMSLRSIRYLEHSQTIFGPPIYPFKVILSIGIFLFLLQGLSHFLRNLYTAFGVEEKGGNGT
jgi:TRAP-type mannitol/chloroaromatic compound transport system permease small subunit